MRPKIERYTTEPKPAEKTKTLSPSRINHNFRSIITKKMEINSAPSNSWDDICFKKNDLESKSFMSTDLKKKNFVVNRRKRNRAVSTYLRETNAFNLARGSWIEQVEQETYQGLRDYNEDRIIVKECIEINNKQFSVFAVFDGHGGSSAAQYLKLNLLKTLERHSKHWDIPEILKKSIEEIQSKILQFGLKIGSGSCATILVTRQNEYWSANVGDSRILIIRGRQDFIQITDDHKPQSTKQIKRIEKLGGKIYRNSIINEFTGQKSYGPYRVYPSRLSVSRTLGDFAIKMGQEQKIISPQPDITNGKLQHGDVIVLMSDGAYQQFSNNEISILFATSGKESLRQRLNNYLIACRKRGTNDNVSLVCLQIKQKSKSTEASEASSIKDFSPSKVEAQI